jgi:hypothetical protein
MNNHQSITRRYLRAYLSLLGIISTFVGVSLIKGAGWKPALAGLPLYLIVFGGITYQLIKELRALKQEKSQDQE